MSTTCLHFTKHLSISNSGMIKNHSYLCTDGYMYLKCRIVLDVTMLSLFVHFVIL